MMELSQALEMAEALSLDNENAISTLGRYGDEVAELLFNEIQRLEKIIEQIKNKAMEQGQDDSIWFTAQTSPEDYLQQKLKELHGVIKEMICQK